MMAKLIKTRFFFLVPVQEYLPLKARFKRPALDMGKTKVVREEGLSKWGIWQASRWGYRKRTQG